MGLDLQGRHHGEGGGQDYSFLLGRLEGEVRKVQSPSWLIPLGKRERGQGGTTLSLEIPLGRGGKVRSPSWAIPPEKRAEESRWYSLLWGLELIKKGL